MKNLVYKELTLTINKFFYVLPLVLALLFFIPNWFFTLIPMYFFWIVVSNIYSSYQSQLDDKFVNMLPVSKKDIVGSKVSSFIILEMIHLGLGAIFAVAHNYIYGMANFALDANYAFFGSVFVLFGIFNIIFLPGYFKTGYKFGKPVIIAIIITLILAALLEISVMAFPSFTQFMESENLGLQLGLLAGGLFIFIMLSYIAYSVSVKRFIKVN